MEQPATAMTPPDSVADRDANIGRLIAGRDVEDIVVYDVSDCQLYGRRHRQRLVGELAGAAKAAGCQAEVYQSVYWFCLAYFPVKPLGTYLVMERQTCDDPDGDAEQYRAVRVPMDRRQIAVHYAVATILVLGAVGVVVLWLTSRLWLASL